LKTTSVFADIASHTFGKKEPVTIEKTLYLALETQLVNYRIAITVRHTALSRLTTEIILMLKKLPIT